MLQTSYLEPLLCSIRTHLSNSSKLKQLDLKYSKALVHKSRFGIEKTIKMYLLIRKVETGVAYRVTHFPKDRFEVSWPYKKYL